MDKGQKRIILRIVITAVLFFFLLFSGHSDLFDGKTELTLYIFAYLLIGYDIIIKAFKNIIRGQIFDENFLMITASAAALCIGEFSEGVAVMLFYQVGELFQGYAVGKSRRSIADMMDIAPEYANIEENGVLLQVDPEDVSVGSIIIIKPGERVPLDGVVVEGQSMVDTSALTGESVPRRACTGDELISGCVNGSSTLRVKVTKTFENSTVSRILDLVESAGNRKARVENFITRFARIYTPFVTVCAVLLALLPPLILGGGWSEWIRRGCIFLVISCPCALVISVPLGFFGGIGAASKIGVLVKGSNFFEALSELKTIVFDKTGTLTKGEFTVSQILPCGIEADELLRLAALCEGYSNHPIAVSVRQAYKKELSSSCAERYEEISGHGVHAFIEGREMYLGNANLMRLVGIEFKEISNAGTVIYAALDGKFIGSIVISDSIKKNAAKAVSDIKRLGVGRCVMLTGDRQSAAASVAEALGIGEFHSEFLPCDKVEIIEELISSAGRGEKVAFVGDGINDAPVLARADVGIAMGSMGSDAAIEAADVVIMDDDICKIPSIISVAAKTLCIVKENIVFALFVKAAVMFFGAVGFADMWMAVFADVGVSVIAILNSMRAMKIK